MGAVIHILDIEHQGRRVKIAAGPCVYPPRIIGDRGIMKTQWYVTLGRRLANIYKAKGWY